MTWPGKLISGPFEPPFRHRRSPKLVNFIKNTLKMYWFRGIQVRIFDPWNCEAHHSKFNFGTFPSFRSILIGFKSFFHFSFFGQENTWDYRLTQDNKVVDHPEQLLDVFWPSPNGSGGWDNRMVVCEGSTGYSANPPTALKWRYEWPWPLRQSGNRERALSFVRLELPSFFQRTGPRGGLKPD